MATNPNLEISFIDGYFRLLDTLSAESKLDLIAQLTTSIKRDMEGKKKQFKKSFGAFVSEQSAEELIEELRASRFTNRQVESF